jgi:hypothetical protein
MLSHEIFHVNAKAYRSAPLQTPTARNMGKI